MAEYNLEIGQKVGGRFLISEQLATGALGTAYKVVDQETQQYGVLRALPEVFAKRKAVLDRYLHGVSAYTKINSLGLAEIVGFGEDPIPYVVEQFIDGVPFDQVLGFKLKENQAFTLDEVLHVIDPVARCIDALHQLKRVSGGLFPNNIFMAGDDVFLTQSYLYYALPPEALVRVYLRDDDRAHYIAPEFVTNPSGLTPQSDVYSLAVLVWEALSGTSFEHEFKPIDDVNEEINKALERGLADSPDKRHPAVAAFVLDLVRSAGEDELTSYWQEVVISHAQQAVEDVKPKEEPAIIGEETIVESLAEIPSKTTDSDATLFDDEDLEATHDEEPGASSIDQGVQAESDNAHAEGDAAEPDPFTKVASEEAQSNTGKLIGIAAAVALAIGGGAAVLMSSGNTEPEPASVAKQAKPAVDPLAGIAKQAMEDALAQQAKAKGSDPKSAGWKASAEAMASGQKAYALDDYQTAISAFRKAENGFRELAITEKVEKETAVAAKKAAKAAKPSQAKSSGSSRKAAVAAKKCPSGMVAIKAGSFKMGSSSSDVDRDAWEKTLTTVSTASFCIDRYEFPNAKGKKPKQEVSYNGARAQCAKVGKRLCLESEWERACKGSANKKFPYGNTFKQNACSTENADGSAGEVKPSGSLNSCKSSYGVADMSGNVAEWTDSIMDGTSDRILKGGSSTRASYSSRCAARLPRPVSAKLTEFGFRCCSDY